MSTIRKALGQVKAKPLKRAAVQVNSQTAANAVKRRWEIEDAIRDTHARVMHLADHADELVRDVAADAVTEGVAQGIAAAERKAALVSSQHHARDRKRDKLMASFHAAHDQRVKEAGEIRGFEHDDNYQFYVARHRSLYRDSNITFPHDLPKSKRAEYEKRLGSDLAKLSGDPQQTSYYLSDLLRDECEEQDARADRFYQITVEYSEALLARQLAAIERGETPPETDDTADDGDGVSDPLPMYGLSVTISEYIAHIEQDIGGDNG